MFNSDPIDWSSIANCKDENIAELKRQITVLVEENKRLRTNLSDLSARLIDAKAINDKLKLQRLDNE